MGGRPPGRVAQSEEFPGVILGTGVIVHGRVEIEPGAYIGDYCVLGYPAVYELEECREDMVTRIGAETRTGSYCVVHRGARIGRRVWLDDRCTVGPENTIGDQARILYGAQMHWRVSIGRKSVIGGFCCDRATIGDGCIMLGKLIHRLENPRASWDEVEEPAPTLDSQVVVGFDALVIGGVSVQSGSYVAAGAIVTKDVSPGSVVVGTTHYTKQEWIARKRTQDA